MLVRHLLKTALFMGLLLLPATAGAAVAQLSFEQGGTILRNPTDDSFVLRSANLDRVRLTLYRVAQPELLNQISAARATQSITEDGLRTRVMAEAPVVWKSDFVLAGNAASTPQNVPLGMAVGTLPAGVYLLTASSDEAPTVGQWFHHGELGLHVAPAMAGELLIGNMVMTTHRAATVAVPRVRLYLLDNKGNVVNTPNDWRTDNYGAVFWQGPWPAAAVLLRADDDNGNTALLPLSPVAKADGKAVKNRGVVITPDFEGNTVPAGATAAFNIALRGEGGALVEETLRYEFARLSHSYKWLRDKENNWQYQTTATPTVIERGTLRPNRGAGAGAPVRLLLAVTEGRFRLTVSTTDGKMRQSLEFTAGWWRSLPVDAEEPINIAAKLLTPTQIEIVASDTAETDAPRWALIWRPSGPQIRPGNSSVFDLPADRERDKPVIASICVPGKEGAAVSCAATVLDGAVKAK